MDVFVIKRDGSKVPYNIKKIESAITRANNSLISRDFGKISEEKITEIVNYIDETIKSSLKGIDSENCTIDIEKIQDIVEDTFIKFDCIKLAKCYIKYRRDHERYRENRSAFFKMLITKANAEDVQNQNANVDEYSYGGRKGEVDSVVMERLALDIMSEKQRERFLNNEGYPHDKDSYYVGMHNCMSIPYDDCINEYGFECRQTDVRPSKAISTTGQLIAVVGQIQSLQQFGGFSATHTDTTFVPSIRRSFKKNFDMITKIKYNKIYKDIGPDEPLKSENYRFFFNPRKLKAYEIAKELTKREMDQACESLYHNLNTLQSRSGRQDCHLI